MKQRLIDADSLIESLLDCPYDEEIGLKNAKEAGLKENDDTVIIDFWRHCKQSFVNFVNTEPTIDPIKHAHWTRKEYRLMSWWKCSNCNSQEKVISRYCPHCGAKMDEVTE